jgi:hypothetical protein
MKNTYFTPKEVKKLETIISMLPSDFYRQKYTRALALSFAGELSELDRVKFDEFVKSTPASVKRQIDLAAKRFETEFCDSRR